MSDLLLIFIYIFCFIAVFMNLIYFINIIKTRRFMKYKKQKMFDIENQSEDKIDLLVVLPCLREQNIICESIDYFMKLNRKHVNLHILISCTKRELETNSKYGFTQSSAEVARQYIKKLPDDDVKFFVYEANDLMDGDRATQMNEAVKTYLNQNKINVVAVFDADSRPEFNTFEEVAYEYKIDPSVVYQQPENYMYSVEQMAKGKKRGVVLSNALYQNMWTVIREIPMFLSYAKNHKKYMYMNGHGMFFPVDIYKKIEFPEHEVTDGIHIGFRVSMLQENLKPLTCLGFTDPPHEVSKLPQQHKRWYGGAVRLKSCFDWAKTKGKKPNLAFWFEGVWDVIRWACTANVFIITFIANLVLISLSNNIFAYISLGILSFSFLLYCYLFPLWCAKVIDSKRCIHFSAILFMPIAVLFKSFGPDLFIVEKIFRRKIKYQKCERL